MTSSQTLYLIKIDIDDRQMEMGDHLFRTLAVMKRRVYAEEVKMRLRHCFLSTMIPLESALSAQPPSVKPSKRSFSLKQKLPLYYLQAVEKT